MSKTVNVAHILLSHSEIPDAFVERTKAEAKKIIDEAVDRIKDGASFEDVASQVSDCPSGAMGGVLGEVSKGEMVQPFEDVCFGLEEGFVSEVFETEYGYHIAWRYDPKTLQGVNEPEHEHGNGCGC